MGHKYIEDIINIERSPYGFCGEQDRRQTQWKEQKSIYGFDERETWSLDYTFFCWLYERLKMYKNINIVDTSFHKVEYKGQTLTQQECMDKIIDYCERILINNLMDEEIIKLGDEVIDLWKLSYRLFWW